MKDGYRVIDIDTHVLPSLEVLQKRASTALTERWSELTPWFRRVTQPSSGWGDLEQEYTLLNVNPIPYDRNIRQKGVAGTPSAGGRGALEGRIHTFAQADPEVGIQHENSTGRLRDMDREGVDRNLIIPGTWALALTAVDPTLAVEVYAAYHRYMGEYCSEDLDRLKGVMLAPAADPKWCARSIKELSSERWVAAVMPLLPEGVAVDDPDLNPIWSAMDDADLPILYHSFFYEPPYFPGYRDVWGNVVVARTAAHPWGAQRVLAYLLLSGIFDEYPRLRIGFAETGAGWLPYWVRRLRMQSEYLSDDLPQLKGDLVDYFTSGRVFCGIEYYEGEEIAHCVIDTLGDGVLMYQSDFPHPQCHFPESPAIALGWKSIGETSLRKLMAENAESYLRLL